jgi:hypothetical protein
MQVLAEVIPLRRRPSLPSKYHLSAGDHAMIGNLIGVLTDEIVTLGEDASVRVRIYFYFKFHRDSVEHWLSLLLTREEAESRQLAERLGDAYHYVTSADMLDSSRVVCDDYRENLNQLADNLRALLLNHAS